MTSETTSSKIKRKFWAKLVELTRPFKFYPLIYSCWWHRNHNPKQNNTHQQYLTAVPNPGAGIGHQLANWIAGYWFAKQLNLTYAHSPFSTEDWENFLGFGESEVSARSLIKTHGYKKVTLPQFDEFDPHAINLVHKIINSYQGSKVVFFLEQDQTYRDQFGVAEEIRAKFNNAQIRQQDKLQYSPVDFNIAVHIRRGDILQGIKNKNPNLLMRLQGADYFSNVLATTLTHIKTSKPIKIFVFSQGDQEEFSVLNSLGEIRYCNTMGAIESFLHMVRADLLITSKSSFSYKPALLSHGIRICPKDFWHGYPEDPYWILAEPDGSFDPSRLSLG